MPAQGKPSFPRKRGNTGSSRSSRTMTVVDVASARCAALSLLLRLALLRGLLFLRSLLRDFLAFGPCLGQADGDGLLAALDLLAGAAALQRPGLALLHHALDVGGGLLRILPCHDGSPGCGKIIAAEEDGSREASLLSPRERSAVIPAQAGSQ